MIAALLQGVGLGLVICVLMGPIFFTMLGIALHYGKKAALLFVVGVFLSDTIYAMLVFGGAAATDLSSATKWRMGIVGGIIFLIIGGVMLKKTLQHKETTKVALHMRKDPHAITFLGQGFLINTLNPSVIVFWAGAIGAAVSTMEERYLALTLVVATLLTIIITDIIKVHLAHTLKKVLHGKVLHRVHFISSIVIILIGLFIIGRTLLFTH